MVTATPDTVLTVLQQLVREAASAAENAPGAISQAISQAAHDLQELPGQALQQLKDAVSPPDWWGLLAFGLVRLADLDPAHLRVGSWDPEGGWSKALTLTYHDDPADPASPRATLALALTEPGTKGVILAIHADNLVVSPALGPLALRIEGQGNGEWRIPFAGGLAPPATVARLHVALTYQPPSPVGSGPASLALGPLRLEATLMTNGPHWRVEAGLGVPPAGTGFKPTLNLAELLGPLASVLQIDVPSYTPSVWVEEGVAPQFTLGEAHR
jgi:hypothetical protein